MTMDSKVVSRRIRGDIWSRLRTLGFGRFTERTARRHRDRRVDVINFQSFNRYLADRVGCTTFSFSVNLGCFITFLPGYSPRPVREKGGVLLPQEYECQFRRRLQKTILQPELLRTDTWFIGPNGEYLAESIIDAIQLIQQEGIHWFERLSDDRELLRTLVEDDEGETYGFGAKQSPIRMELLKGFRGR